MNLRGYIWRQREKFRAFCNYYYDFKNHIQLSVRYHSKENYTKDMLRCSIMLLNHQLEKAQTYTEQKNGYGREKIIQLEDYLKEYIDKYGIDSLVYTSLGVIHAHLENPFSFKDRKIQTFYDSVLHRQEIDENQLCLCRGGIIHLDVTDYMSINHALEFFKSRHSCRNYSNEPILHEDISDALEYARTAPSACNRQSIRAHYYDTPELMEKIIASQKSDFLWCLKAKGLFIITANKSYFRDYSERNQGMFDAGLFSMNLVMGLHNLGIGSCFKMAQKQHSVDDETKKLAGIPEAEDICVLILCGKYPKNRATIAKSSRLDINEILTFHK